jgi:ubiquinone biosynthesis protein UbiJ
MLEKPALAVLNHLLASEDWARCKLVPFAGKTARLQLGSGIVFLVRISEDGLLEVADANTPPTVSIILPADSPVRALTDSASLLSAATISGSADLAETLGFLYRNLRWDIEEDLSQVVGDIVARRAVQLMGRLARWQVSGARNFALSVTEYLTEEAPAIARRQDIERFCAEVDALRDDLARCEKRLERVRLG